MPALKQNLMWQEMNPRKLAAALNNRAKETCERDSPEAAVEIYQEAMRTILRTAKSEVSPHGARQDCDLDIENRIALVHQILSSVSTCGRIGMRDNAHNHQNFTTPTDALHIEPSQLADGYLGEIQGLAIILYNAGLLLLRLSCFSTAKKLFETAMDIVPEPCKYNPIFAMLRAISLNNICHIDCCLGMLEIAAKNITEAILLVERVFVSSEKGGYTSRQLEGLPSGFVNRQGMLRDHLQTVVFNHGVVLCKVSEVYERQGMHIKTMLVYVQVLRIHQGGILQGLADDTLLLHSNVLHRMGVFHFKAKVFDLAIKAFELSIHLRTVAVGCPDETAASMLKDLACAQIDAEKNEDAICSFKKCLRLQRVLLGDSHAEIAETLSCLGHFYLKVGNFQKALKVFRGVLNVETQTYGVQHINVAVTFATIGRIQCMCGRKESALSSYMEALMTVRLHLGEHHPFVSDLVTLIVTILRGLGRHEEASNFLPNHVRQNTIPEGSTDLSTLKPVIDSCAESSQGLGAAAA